jgi:hypothetical protein
VRKNGISAYFTGLLVSQHLHYLAGMLLPEIESIGRNGFFHGPTEPVIDAW